MSVEHSCGPAHEKRNVAWNVDPYNVKAQKRAAAALARAERRCPACRRETRNAALLQAARHIASGAA